jgi:hypothetical protein
MESKKEKKYIVETIGIPLFSELDKKDYDSFVATLVFSIKGYLAEKEKDKKPP